MALNTRIPVQQVGNTTEELSTKVGVAKQLVIDTVKNTAVIMDGSTAGGHPLAKEAVKIKSGSPNLKINGGTESNLGGDLTITVLPGYVPTGFEYVRNPEGELAGTYLAVNYTDENGDAQTYYVDAAMLVDTYKAGDGIVISGDNTISVDSDAISAGAFIGTNSGLALDTDGKLYIDYGDGLKLEDGQLVLDIDENSLLTIKNGKLSLKSIVSEDEDNILATGSDGGVYMPGDLGSLGE